MSSSRAAVRSSQDRVFSCSATACTRFTKPMVKNGTFDEFVDYLSVIRQSSDAPIDQLLQHVRQLGGSDQLDDDFSMFEAKFGT